MFADDNESEVSKHHSFDNNRKELIGNHRLLSDLLLGNYFVAIPFPDYGEDLWLSRDRLGAVLKVQVKCIFSIRPGSSSRAPGKRGTLNETYFEFQNNISEKWFLETKGRADICLVIGCHVSILQHRNPFPGTEYVWAVIPCTELSTRLGPYETKKKKIRFSLSVYESGAAEFSHSRKGLVTQVALYRRPEAMFNEIV